MHAETARSSLATSFTWVHCEWSTVQCSAVWCASPIIVHTDVGDVNHIHMVQPMAAHTQHVATLVVLAVRSGQQW